MVAFDQNTSICSMPGQSELAIVAICNKVAGDDRFTTFADILKQPVTMHIEGVPFYPLSDDGKFLISIVTDVVNNTTECKVLDTATMDWVSAHF